MDVGSFGNIFLLSELLLEIAELVHEKLVSVAKLVEFFIHNKKRLIGGFVKNTKIGALKFILLINYHLFFEVSKLSIFCCLIKLS
jgi:hypothetical protein